MANGHAAIDSLIANATLQQYQKGGQVKKASIDDVVKGIYSDMPMLKKHDFVVKRVDRPSEYGGNIEFMSPEEPDNPYGKPYVELYEGAPTEAGALKQAIWGDMLHQLSDADPYWTLLRDEYMADRPEKVRAMDERAYKRSGDERSFDKWMDVSRADAHIRAGLQGYPNWADTPRTDKQVNILKKMYEYLQHGQSQ